MNTIEKSQVQEDSATTFLNPHTTPETKEVNKISRVDPSIYSTSYGVETIADLLSTDILVGTYSWNTGQAVNTEVFDITLLSAINLNPMKTFLNNFTFIKPDILITVVFNPSNMHLGSLQVVWKPVSDFNTNVYRMTSMRGLHINANKSTTQQLRIPYDHIYSNLDTYHDTPYNILGHLEAKVLNQLRTESSQNNLSISIFVKCEGSKLTLPTATHNYAPQSFDEIMKFNKTSNIGIKQKVIDCSISSDDEVLCMKELINKSTIADIVDGIYNLVPQSMDSILKDVGEIVSDVSNAVEKGMTVAKIAGEALAFDNPLLEIPSSQRIIQDTVHGAGGRSGIRLQLIQEGRTYYPGEYEPSKEDEMDMHRIAQIPAVFRTINISTALPTGTELVNIEYTPKYFTISRAPGLYQDAPIMYTSRCFQLWTGDIILTFDFIATSFHKMQAILTYTPANESEISYQEALNSPKVIMNLSEKSRFTIRIAYNSHVPFLPYGDELAMNRKDTCGQIKLWVMNPLVTTGTVPDNIDLNIYASAADNFQMMNRNEGFFNWTPQSYDSAKHGIENPSERPEEDDPTINFAGLPTKRKPIEDEMHLKTFLSVPSNITSGVNTISDQVPYILASFPTTLTSANNLTIRNYLDYWAQCFMFFRGSIRYHFFMLDNNTPSLYSFKIKPWQTNVGYNYSASTTTPDQSFLYDTYQQVYTTEIKPSSTFEVAYSSPYTKVFASEKPGFLVGTDYLKTSNAYVVYQSQNPKNEKVRLLIAKSIGNDAKLSHWVGVPERG
jgi:hypothetical protein